MKKDKIYILIINNDKKEDFLNLVETFKFSFNEYPYSENKLIMLCQFITQRDSLEESFEKKISKIARWVKTMPLRSSNFFTEHNTLPKF